VKKNLQHVCRCHGVSGSCSIKTCWKQLAPFERTAELVKLKYDAATLVKTGINSAQKMPMIALRKTDDGADVEGVPHPTELVFSETSPSFCKNGRYSFGTHNRRCDKAKNCGVICCGRGYNAQIRTVSKPCNCRMHWCCELKCDNCTFEEDHFLCKWSSRLRGCVFYQLSYFISSGCDGGISWKGDYRVAIYLRIEG
jgi:wingless-type MMTV integration site family protein 9